MRLPAIALASAIGGALLVPAVPLAAGEPGAAPTAALESASSSVPAGSKVKLDSSHSTGTIVDRLWDLDGDGSYEKDGGTKPDVVLTPKQPGTLKVHVKVVDDQGRSAEAELPLTVTAAPSMTPAAPVVAAPAAGDSNPPRHHPSGGAGHAHGAPAGGGPGAGARPQHARPAPSWDAAAAPAAAPAQSGSATPLPQPGDPGARVARMAHSPGALAAVPMMVASGRIAAMPAKRSAAKVHAAGASSVTIKNFAFAPGTVTVHTGDTISWTNQDVAPHSATASNGSFDTGVLQKGKTGSATFSKPGTISYICSVHPNMHGTVVVEAAVSVGSSPGGSTAAPGTGSNSASPSAASAPTGSGGLPQTGLNLAAVVLMAMLLMGSGTVLRSRAGRES